MTKGRATMPNVEWSGFAPIGYTLDFGKVRATEVVELGDHGAKTPTTVGAILREVLPHRFGEPTANAKGE